MCGLFFVNFYQKGSSFVFLNIFSSKYILIQYERIFNITDVINVFIKSYMKKYKRIVTSIFLISC